MACKKADRPSMMIRMPTVSVNHAAKPPTRPKAAVMPVDAKKLASVMSHSTTDSSGGAPATPSRDGNRGAERDGQHRSLTIATGKRTRQSPRKAGAYVRACASDKAHRRRYDAVFEMAPRQNSIV